MLDTDEKRHLMAVITKMKSDHDAKVDCMEMELGDLQGEIDNLKQDIKNLYKIIGGT